MATIDFSRLEIFSDIARTRCTVVDARKVISDAIYVNGYGIESHALALKIYNSVGPCEYDERECAIIMDFAHRCGTPSLIDALKEKCLG